MPVTLHGSFVHAPDRMIGDAFENMAQVVLGIASVEPGGLDQ